MRIIQTLFENRRKFLRGNLPRKISFDFCLEKAVLQLALQPIPEKMRLEMVNEMQIEILNGGESLIN